MLRASILRPVARQVGTISSISPVNVLPVRVNAILMIRNVRQTGWTVLDWAEVQAW